MPEWAAAILFGAVISSVLAIIGWLIVNKLNGIDAKLDRYEERQAKVEKDCITWEQLEHEFEQHVDPWKATVIKHDRAIVAIQVACEQRHK